MLPDPARTTRIINYASKALWIVMAWAGGSMVGHLILYARAAASS
jgi:hypothetical protein